MSKTISKGRLFRVTTEVNDERLKAMKKVPEATAAALQAGADYWHTGILPLHFKSDAHGKYGYAARSRNYLKQRGKRGKPDLVFGGSMERDLTSRATFKQAGSFLELRMTARVLNFAPAMPQNTLDHYVKHKNGRGYPNLKREVTVVIEGERETIATVVAGSLEKSFAAESTTTVEPLPG